MSITLTIDTTALERFIHTKNKVFFEAVKKHIAKAGWQFVRFVTLTQLSGRVSSTFGVNVITGTLRRSFKSKVVGDDKVGDVAMKIYSTARYADYLQNPSDMNRKKLHVWERFQVEGLRFYREELSLAIKEATK